MFERYDVPISDASAPRDTSIINVSLEAWFVQSLLGFSNMLQDERLWFGDEPQVRSATNASEKGILALMTAISTQCEDFRINNLVMPATTSRCDCEEEYEGEHMSCCIYITNDGRIGTVVCGQFIPAQPVPLGTRVPDAIPGETVIPPITGEIVIPLPELDDSEYPPNDVACYKATALWQHIDDCVKIAADVFQNDNIPGAPDAGGKVIGQLTTKGKVAGFDLLQLMPTLTIHELANNITGSDYFDEWSERNNEIKSLFICKAALSLSRNEWDANDLDYIHNFRWSDVINGVQLQWFLGGVMASDLADTIGGIIKQLLINVIEEYLPGDFSSIFVNGFVQTMTNSSLRRITNMGIASKTGDCDTCPGLGGGDPILLPPSTGTNKLMFKEFGSNPFWVLDKNSYAAMKSAGEHGSRVFSNFFGEYVFDQTYSESLSIVNAILEFAEPVTLNRIDWIVSVNETHTTLRLQNWAHPGPPGSAWFEATSGGYTNNNGQPVTASLYGQYAGQTTKFISIGGFALAGGQNNERKISLLNVRIQCTYGGQSFTVQVGQEFG